MRTAAVCACAEAVPRVTSAAPTEAPGPAITLRTPPGIPAALASAPSRSALQGVALAGLAAPTVAEAQPPAPVPVFAFWPGCPQDDQSGNRMINPEVLDNVCHTAAVAYARAVSAEGAG